MKTKLNGILTLLLALVVQVAFAQQTVTGKVTDADGGLLGAVVSVKGGSANATTDFDGNYTILAGPEDTLTFTYSGYETVSLLVGNQTVINTTMQASLDTVVLIGYRNSTKPRSNIASTTVDSKEIVDRPNASVIQRLQGQVSGLTVQTSTGQPGANSLIQLRGISSINGNTEPLILVDGVPVDEDAFATFNPNDVENMTVLKDAAGTAIYGNRGANGVILITTKRGEFDSPLSVSYTGTTSFTEFIDTDYNLYDSRGLLSLENRRGAGFGNTLTEAEIAAYDIQTDWNDVFFRTGVNQSHNLSLSSGGKKSRQFTSINYTRQEGTLLATDLQRFNIRTNISGKSDNDRFTYSTTASLGYSQSNSQTETQNNRNGLFFFSSILGANRGLPYVDINEYSPELLTGISAFTARNAPFVTFDNIQFNRNREDELKLILGGNFEYKLNKDFTLAYNMGADYGQTVGLRVVDPRSALARIRASFISPTAVEGSQREEYLRDFRFNSNLSLRFKRSYGEKDQHTVIANGYVEYVKGHYKDFRYVQTGLNPRTFSPGNNGGAFIGDTANDDNNVPFVTSNKASTGLFSYFGEFDYDYDDKYGFQATLRRDASSRFTADNAWGTFYSVAGRWNLHQEAFLSEVNWLNTLKLRASYGTTGNDRINELDGIGGYYGALNSTRTLFNTEQSYNDQQTFTRDQIGNEDLRWETIKTVNIGIDFEMFDNRLRGAIDAYERKTEDLFFSRSTSLITGVSQIDANLGDISNTGIELTASYDLFRANNSDEVNLRIFGNIAYNRNQADFIDLPDGLRDDINDGTVIQEGQRINEFFVVPYRGVNPATGNLLYEDINGELTENPTLEDRRLTGTSSIPDFFGGFGFNASYKNFFLETQFSYMTGLQRFDNNLFNYLNPAEIGQLQLSSDLDRAWTIDNRVTDIPSLDANNISPGVSSDRFLVDSDFLRLRFLQIGYNFNQEMLDRTFLKSARVYANGENLATWTGWLGSDPESSRSVEENRFPTPRIISVGLDLTF
ncbi:SusC/RagA family TonB-linked outer membrane protein [uncultured Nonlabens sp.]|uniref:SusC/RagA family TonB-linked outer membrane protein n=1 Tax=uncultured Nonlabens sp. TaxID=859306 RepID=UPI002603AC4F|nr:SusC/RagA family TonB-linked outer membrane protein [uncultured Nonlabens sp.]